MIKNYINIGVAVDTDEGLIVPVIRNADNLKIDELAEQIVTLSEKAKAKKLLQKDMTGATFTVSSLGFMGGTGFTNNKILLKLGSLEFQEVEHNLLERMIKLWMKLSYRYRCLMITELLMGRMQVNL